MAWLQDMIEGIVVKDAEHWTKRIKRDNGLLRASLEWYRQEVKFLIQSRFDKLHDYPTPGGMDSYDLGYQAALQEIDNRLGALDTEMLASSITEAMKELQ